MRLLIILSVVVLVGLGGLGYGLWEHYSQKYRKIDQTSAKLNISSSETVYQNSEYGVTLRLPGAWTRAKGPYPAFCTLSGPDNFAAMFWPVFPTLGPSLDQDAAGLRRGFATEGHYQLKKEESLEINGEPPRELRFGTPFGGMDLTSVVVKKGLVVYALAMTGPANSHDAWQRMEAALPRAMEIK